MRRQLDDIRERGEPVAALWASEGAIYWRFGYGPAAFGAVVDIERSAARYLPGVAGSGPGGLRTVEKDELLRLAPSVYDAVRSERPGMVDRSPTWWEYLFRDDPDQRHGYGQMLFVVHETEGVADGYAVYRVKDDWGATGPRAKVGVQELLSTSPDARARLWRHLTDADLTVRCEYWNAPVDDPFFHLLTDPRRAETRVKEALWVRVLEVETALAARRYAVSDRLVFELEDPFLPANSGRYEIRGSPDGAECWRTEEEPDLAMQARDLGSLYLGGTSVTALVGAGRVWARSPAVARRADAFIRWSPAPWSPHLF
jgi:predicted acetyltransferase